MLRLLRTSRSGRVGENARRLTQSPHVAGKSARSKLARHLPSFTGVAGVRDHRDLEVWKLADALRRESLKLTERESFRQDWDLRRQLNRAASSVASNVAEGFGRFLPGDFARFMRIAKASALETIEHAATSADRRLISEDERDVLVRLAKRTAGACTRLIVYLETAKPPGRT